MNWSSGATKTPLVILLVKLTAIKIPLKDPLITTHVQTGGQGATTI
jgi:hypothetical protein